MKVNFQLAAILLFWAFNASSAVRYVNQDNANPTTPFTDWSIAATNIQDAIDIADAGDQILVTNGVYKTGGRFVPIDVTMNRVAVTKAVTVQSVNGPDVTVIEGFQVPGTIFGTNAVRCVYLTNNASLIGFTLTNGATAFPGNNFIKLQFPHGGGVFSTRFQPPSSSNSFAFVANCVLSGNAAAKEGGGAYGVVLKNCIVRGNSAYSGGGAASCVLSNCTLASNVAVENDGPILVPSLKSGGGGAYGCQLESCLVLGNSAKYGGGTFGSDLNNCTVVGNTASVSGGGVSDSGSPYFGSFPDGFTNCIILFNSASNSPNYSSEAPNLVHCCTSPLPPGTGNFTNDPIFMDLAGGNFRLQSNSPCINAGKNSSLNGFDLAGNPRVVGGTVDIGAYEFQTPGSLLSYAWAQHYGLPTDGSADFADADGDGLNNKSEWIAGTNPTNALSALGMLKATPALNPPRATVQWKSVIGRLYFLQRAIELTSPAVFATIKSNIVSQGSITTFTDTNAIGLGPFFYRVGVQEP